MSREKIAEIFDICCTIIIFTIFIIHLFVIPLSNMTITICIVYMWINYIMWSGVLLFSLTGVVIIKRSMRDAFNNANVMKFIELMRGHYEKYKKYRVYKFIICLAFIFALTFMGHMFLAILIIFNFVISEVLFIDKLSKLIKYYDVLHYIDNKVM